MSYIDRINNRDRLTNSDIHDAIYSFSKDNGIEDRVKNIVIINRDDPEQDKISLGSYNAYSAEYDAMYQAWLDSQKDENGRIPIKVAGVDPTETTVGYTPGKKDKITGEFFEGHEEIPMINSDNYDRVVKNNGDSGLVVTLR